MTQKTPAWMWKLAEKIGEGNFRECFALQGEPGLCYKRIKPHLGFMQRLQVIFLRRRMNQEEMKTYNALPPVLKPYFNPIVDAGKSFLVSERPIDFDGSYSRPLNDYGKVGNACFWEQTEQLVKLLDRHRMWFLDIFGSTNVIVQRLDEKQWKPIIIDYKHLGWKAFPMQMNLVLGSERRKKFYRNYLRFKSHFRADA